MGGVIGAVSGKLVLGTAALLFSAKVDQRNVVAVIDGDAPTSAISERLGERLLGPHAPQEAGRREARAWLHLDGGMFKVTLPIVTHGIIDRADVLLGQDILAAHFLRLDFHHRVSQLVLPDRLKHETRNMTAIPIETAPDGTILVAVRMADGVTTRARLQFNFHIEAGDAHAEAALAPIALLGRDNTKVQDIDDYHVDNVGRASTVFIDLRTFDDQVILLDLPHKQLWVSGRRAVT